MVDLMDLFKTAYVDIGFGGSTSIKRVLPVLCPDLSYAAMDVSDGTAAMEAWGRFVDAETDASERERLKAALLDYCALDTLAMVEIFRVVGGVGKEET